MFIQFLLWLAHVCGKTVVGLFLKKAAEKLLGRPLDECKKEFDQALEHAQSVFHRCYGNRFGTSNSTFIEYNRNRTKLWLSTFPRGKPLTAIDLNLEGFNGYPKVSEEAANFFLVTFYGDLDQTSSRTLVYCYKNSCSVK